MNEPEDELEAAADEAEAPAAGEGDASLGPGEADLGAEGELDEDDEHEGPGLAGAVSLSAADLPGALEALILVSDKPIPAVRLARLTRQDVGLVKARLAELQGAYRGRGIVLDEIAGGFQFRTSGRYAPFVRNLSQQKPTKLSRAQLEVLAIIAYRQPVTRPEIEDVRGVDSGSALKVLLERNVIKIIGKKEEAGRPMLYGTSSEFLELFGLKSLRDLPTLKEFAELTPESRDIFERRIGEPVPDSGMNLETHYEAPTDRPPEDDEPSAEADAGEGETVPPSDGAHAAAEGEDAAADGENAALASEDAAAEGEDAALESEPPGPSAGEGEEEGGDDTIVGQTLDLSELPPHEEGP
jgi:segregation and condensation protein B